mgnify:CR=1 FL=1
MRKFREKYGLVANPLLALQSGQGGAGEHMEPELTAEELALQERRRRMRERRLSHGQDGEPSGIEIMSMEGKGGRSQNASD